MTGKTPRRRVRPLNDAASTRLRWAVRVTGSVNPGIRLADAIDVLDQSQPAAVAHVIVEEKLVSLALRTLHDNRPELARALEANKEIAAQVARLAKANDSLPHLMKIIDDAKPPEREIALLKGAAARSWYPEPIMRDLGDLDLVVDRMADAFGLAHVLRSHGYEPALPEPPWVKRTHPGGDTYGQINLVAPRDDSLLAVDIHFGGYSVRHCGLITSRNGISDPTFNLACIVANAAGDYRITGKDLNDIYQTLSSGVVRLPDLVDTVAACHLTGFLSRMISAMLSTHELSSELHRELTHYVSTHLPEWPDANRRTFMWQRRWAGTVLHAWKVGADRSIPAAVWSSATAALYYARRLRLHPLRFAARGRWHEPAPWTCVRLIPLSVERDRVVVAPGPAIGETLRRAALGNHSVVVTEHEVLAPTVFYGLPQDVLAKVRGVDR